MKKVGKGFDEIIEKLNKIKSNYLSQNILKEVDEKYYLITFLNFLNIIWSLNNTWKIDTFLSFFGLVNWSKKDKLNYFYHKYFE